MDLLGLRARDDGAPLPGSTYIRILDKYVKSNLPRLAPSRPQSPSALQQAYTVFTLGLDPSSAPLSRNLKVPLTLGFGTPQAPRGPPAKPLLLRLPPDRLLYLLLRWQSLPQGLPHVGRTDVPVPDGVVLAARGEMEERGKGKEGDVRSVRSWVGSMRSVSMGSEMGWFRKQEINEDQVLLGLYSIFTVLPALLIHPSRSTDKPIAELVEAGGYTTLGGIDVRIPLDVLRNLQILELESYDPRGLLIPPNPGLRSLTVRDVQDGDDWIMELLTVDDRPNDEAASPESAHSTDESPGPLAPSARFPNLRHLSLPSCTLLNLPNLPLSSLTHLDLSHNLLDSLPSSLSQLSSLVSLNLSNNVITSVRNAPAVLGNITTLNLSHNRIDCLVGLERVMGLHRVDVRGNELPEVGEVGRLALLPYLQEVWCSKNPFDQATQQLSAVEPDDWRVQLGVAFGLEDREVVVEDRAFSWTEKRSIDAKLAALGHQPGRSQRQPVTPATPPSRPPAPPHDHLRRPASTQAPTSSAPPSVPQTLNPTATGSNGSQAGPPTLNSTATGSIGPQARPPSAASSTAKVAHQKKRRPRRVIELDSSETVPTSAVNQAKDARAVGGSMPLPNRSAQAPDHSAAGRGGPSDGRSTGSTTAADDGDGLAAPEPAVQSVKVGRKGGRRARVSASMFEAPSDPSN